MRGASVRGDARHGHGVTDRPGTYGCDDAANFTTFGHATSPGAVNLYASAPRPRPWARSVVDAVFGVSAVEAVLGPAPAPEARQWGRAIFYVDDVDKAYALATKNGLRPEHEPQDAPWGERYFAILDPARNELSIAAPLSRGAGAAAA